MPIDRVFSIPGQGTVVTGTVLGGSVQLSDSLMLMPAEAPVRVRRLQAHGQPLTQVSAHRRAAFNLAGICPDEVQRGDELTVPGFLQPTRPV